MIDYQVSATLSDLRKSIAFLNQVLTRMLLTRKEMETMLLKQSSFRRNWNRV